MILDLISGNAYHVRRANAGPKKRDDLGDGHRSLPAHVYLSILGLIPEDAHHVRQPDAYQNKQGDGLGDGLGDVWVTNWRLGRK